MSDVDNKVKMVVEGLLLAAGRPLTLDSISQVFSEKERPDKKELKSVMEAIAESCDDRGFELKEVASGYRFQVKQELSEWVAKLWEERPPRYTRALLETLALIAYRQPITRGDIEEIRGVGVSANIIRTLLDREWVRVVGHRDVPGRPAMFATTKQFLDYFNLKSLQELPPLAEIKDLDKTETELDIGDDLAGQRVIELPDDLEDEKSIELTAAEEAELLAEEEAVALSKKPLDEILGLKPEEDEVEGGDLDEGEGSDAETSEDAANENTEESSGESAEESAEESTEENAEENSEELTAEESIEDDSKENNTPDFDDFPDDDVSDFSITLDVADDEQASDSDEDNSEGGSELDSGGMDFIIDDEPQDPDR